MLTTTKDMGETIEKDLEKEDELLSSDDSEDEVDEEEINDQIIGFLEKKVQRVKTKYKLQMKNVMMRVSGREYPLKALTVVVQW